MAKKPFDPVEFYQFAEEIASQRQRQVALRTAVGRAYYAMFLLARAKTGVRVKQDAHETVINALEERNEHHIATELGQLRRLREAADYQLMPDVRPLHSWPNNWLWAKRIVLDIRPKLEAMPKTSPPRPPEAPRQRRTRG
jgi:uncharacterized protein (UPF0332 family)